MFWPFIFSLMVTICFAYILYTIEFVYYWYMIGGFNYLQKAPYKHIIPVLVIFGVFLGSFWLFRKWLIPDYVPRANTLPPFSEQQEEWLHKEFEQYMKQYKRKK